MQSKVAAYAATPDPNFGSKPREGRPAKSGLPDLVQPIEEQADLRLVIEEDETSGSYVYKTVNRLTGEVVQQLPREDLLKLRDEADYVAGKVIRTRA